VEAANAAVPFRPDDPFYSKDYLTPPRKSERDMTSGQKGG
jgi:hypothetical protein